MAVSSTTVAVSYAGNESTSVAYEIPFPFFDESHIYVATIDGEEEPVLLAQSDFVVTQLEDNSGGSLVTNEAIDSSLTVRIFRSLPLKQTATFQAQGAFPPKTNEAALDRTVMMIQQLASRIAELEGVEDESVIHVPTGGTDLIDVPTWANAAARGAVAPRRAGQLGVQRSDGTIWIAQSADTGDWEPFYTARRTNRLILGYVADAGDPGDEQDDAADLLTAWQDGYGLDAVLFAGDNNYNGAAGYTADWAAFADFIADGIAYPALGNHDLDSTGWEALHAAKFPYLPGNKRYYNVVLGDGLVELFVLNSGRNSTWDLIEEDGNEVGSDQHAWFVAALAASTARWKIAMFHHPPASLNGNANIIEPNMAWPEFTKLDLLLCGHSHLLEILKWDNVQLVNLSASINPSGSDAETINGGDASDAALWSNHHSLAIGRIVATDDKLTVEAWEPNQGYGITTSILHARDSRDLMPTMLAKVDNLAIFGGRAHEGSMAIGPDATAYDIGLAIGKGAQSGVTGAGNGVAIGCNASGPHLGALVIGNQATVAGKGGTALGNFAQAPVAVSIGCLTVAGGGDAPAGRGNVAIGTDDPDAGDTLPCAIPEGATWIDTVMLGRGTATVKEGLNFRNRGAVAKYRKVLNAVNLDDVADTEITGLPAKWIPAALYVTDTSTDLSGLATVATLRTAAAGGGDDLLSALTLTGLTAAEKIAAGTLAAVSEYQTGATAYFRVSTAAGSAATARVIFEYFDVTG